MMKKVMQQMMLILAIVMSVPTILMAQSKAKADTVTIKTSAVCNTCKQRIENDLSFAKGVKKVTLDLKSQNVTVLYDTAKTNPDALRKAITLIGYDADGWIADEKAYNKLPDCCKKGNQPH